MTEWSSFSTAVVLLIIGAVISLLIWRLQRKIEKNESNRAAKEDDREAVRTEWQILQVQSGNAALTGIIAVAEAVRDGHCNGNVTNALKEANIAKKDQEKFLTRQGVEHVNAEKQGR